MTRFKPSEAAVGEFRRLAREFDELTTRPSNTRSDTQMIGARSPVEAVDGIDYHCQNNPTCHNWTRTDFINFSIRVALSYLGSEAANTDEHYDEIVDRLDSYYDAERATQALKSGTSDDNFLSKIVIEVQSAGTEKLQRIEARLHRIIAASNGPRLGTAQNALALVEAQIAALTGD